MYRGPSRSAAALLVAGALAASMSGAAHADRTARATKVETVIDTVFGTGDPGTTGDGGPAAEAAIDRPLQLASAPDGTLYIVTDGRIRAVDPKDGTIRTVAGTGKFGFSGDGASATKATFSKPGGAGTGLQGIAVGPDGTLYIADAGNNRVRAVDPKNGRIRTVAGSGKTGEGKFGGDGGPATEAHLDGPKDVAVGRDGTLYIVDRFNYRIRAVDPKTHEIRTVAGQTTPGDSGSGFFPRPADRGNRATQTSIHASAIAVGPDGTVFLAGTDDTIRAIDVEHDTITTVADDRTPGLTGPTFFDHPTDLAFGRDGRLYVTCTAESGNDPRQNIVYAIDVKKRRIEHVAGGGAQGLGDAGPAASASIGGPEGLEPMGIAVAPKGTIYVADAANNRIRAIERKKVTRRATKARLASHDIATVVGSGRHLGKKEEEQEYEKEEGAFYRDVHPRREVNLDFPSSVAVDRDGTIYVADTANDRVRAVDPDDGKVRTIAGRTDAESAMDDDGSGNGGQATEAEILSPTGLAIGPDRKLYIAEHGYEGAVRVVDLDDGRIDTVVGTRGDVNPPSDVAVTKTGDLYVAYAGEHRVCVVERGSKSCRTVADDESGEVVDTPGDVAMPTGLAIGPDGDLFIADAGSSRVLRLDKKTGDLTTVAGVAQMRVGLFARPNQPYASGDGGPARSADIGIVAGIDVGPDGTLYLTDAANHRIRAVDPKTGIIRTVAGTGRYRPIRREDANPGGNTPGDGGGFGGDGRSAGKAKLDQPQDVTVGPGGALYIADGGNNRIRAVDAPDLPAGYNVVGWLVTGGVVFVVLLGVAWLLRWYVRRRAGRREREAAAVPSEDGTPTQVAAPHPDEPDQR